MDRRADGRAGGRRIGLVGGATASGIGVKGGARSPAGSGRRRTAACHRGTAFERAWAWVGAVRQCRIERGHGRCSAIRSGHRASAGRGDCQAWCGHRRGDRERRGRRRRWRRVHQHGRGARDDRLRRADHAVGVRGRVGAGIGEPSNGAGSRGGSAESGNVSVGGAVGTGIGSAVGNVGPAAIGVDGSTGSHRGFFRHRAADLGERLTGIGHGRRAGREGRRGFLAADGELFPGLLWRSGPGRRAWGDSRPARPAVMAAGSVGRPARPRASCTPGRAVPRTRSRPCEVVASSLPPSGRAVPRSDDRGEPPGIPRRVGDSSRTEIKIPGRPGFPPYRGRARLPGTAQRWDDRATAWGWCVS